MFSSGRGLFNFFGGSGRGKNFKLKQQSFFKMLSQSGQVVEVCVLSQTGYTNEFLEKHFPIHVVPVTTSFPQARNLCLSMIKSPYALRIDTDEELQDVARVKRDAMLGLDAIAAKIVNFVDDYRWVGYKIVLHRSNLRYTGITHEILMGAKTIGYDPQLIILHRRNMHQYAMSMARDYYFIPRYDPKWFKLRKIIGAKTLPAFYEVMQNPPTPLLEFGKTFTQCVPKEREVYLALFHEYPKDECRYDLPNYVATAEKVEKALPFYDPWVIEYAIDHPDFLNHPTVKKWLATPFV